MTYFRIILCHLLLLTSAWASPPETPAKVTIIGAGLAGLTAAFIDHTGNMPLTTQPFPTPSGMRPNQLTPRSITYVKAHCRPAT